VTNSSLSYPRRWFVSDWRSRFSGSLGAISSAVDGLLIALLIAAGLAGHGLNMFHNPTFFFLDDEGIYTEQAWAVIQAHRLAPYTYFYDHAPGGWILLGAWMFITGGVHSFGNAIDSGRVLMLLLNLASIALVYRVARKFGCGPLPAAVGALLLCLSPLAIFYQRMVLLDSIMLFWALLSLDLLLDGWGRLSRVVLSGACFGIALVSKETAIFLLPPMLYVAFLQRWRHQGHFAIAGWVVPMLIVSSWYLLYALLKGELLPTIGSAGFVTSGDSIAGGSGSRVSLLGALFWQTARGGGGIFNLHNEFWLLLRTDWLMRDRLLIVAGALATVVNLLRGLRDRRALAAGLLALIPIAYLARGGVVLDYYALIVLPFFCINIALLLEPLGNRLPTLANPFMLGATGLALLIGYLHFGQLQPLFVDRPDAGGRDATVWIKQRLSPQSLIVTRDSFFTDLRTPGLGGPAFPNVHSHWKVGLDPAIRDGVFHDNWQTVDYLLLTPGLDQDFKNSNDTVALDALAHGHMIRQWTSDAGPIGLWMVDKPDVSGASVMALSNAYIDDHFDTLGAVSDSSGNVTSESQAYAMLRAVWLNDPAGFYRVWSWSRTNLLGPQRLMGWSWRDGALTDPHSASDADTDAAIALLMAGKRWQDSNLIQAGQSMIEAIWIQDVASVQGKPYLTAGNWATTGPLITINPSYFAPYAYHIFAEVDHSHDWLALVDSSYQLLFDASAAPLGSSRSDGLPPDWVGLDSASGQLVPANGNDAGAYGYDAPRTYWRVAIDQRWTGDGRAQRFLSLAQFLQGEIAAKGYTSAVYARDGSIIQSGPSLVGDAGSLAALLTIDPSSAAAVYAQQVLGTSQRSDDGLYWGDPHDLYGQEWGWFATGLYSGSLADIWHQ
jgi:endo-1,4-beta-D-glucanase Y/4-amino-4-deoxy-L-arabinose transferase-like glycosyltransferase